MKITENFESLLLLAICYIAIAIIMAIFGIVSILYIHAELTKLNELKQINGYFLIYFLIAKVHIRKIKELRAAF